MKSKNGSGTSTLNTWCASPKLRHSSSSKPHDPRLYPATLRQQVYERAEGRCEYCLIPETVTLTTHQVESHRCPQAWWSHRGRHLALSCALCNKHKGSDLASLDPETGEIAPLYHPRRDRWVNHFQVSALTSFLSRLWAALQFGCCSSIKSERVAEREFAYRVCALRVSS